MPPSGNAAAVRLNLSTSIHDDSVQDREQIIAYRCPVSPDILRGICKTGYQNPKGQYRVPTVLDNLIQHKKLPVMIGIFIDPGSNSLKGGKGGGPGIGVPR